MLEKIAMSICAHPDDAEFGCTGTLALLHQKGWEIHMATITAGDCGSKDMTCEQTAIVRKAEGTAAAAILNGKYHCLDCDDVFIMYDKPTLLKTIALIRQVRPSIIFTCSPVDYAMDHETTSKIVWSACFAAGIPNVDTPGLAPCKNVPYLYYLDVLNAKDNFGNDIESGLFVDISSVIEIKKKMLSCHESQRKWLKDYHGYDNYIEVMEAHSRQRGKIANCEFSEGFRQHLGHSFLQDDILKTLLADNYIG